MNTVTRSNIARFSKPDFTGKSKVTKPESTAPSPSVPVPALPLATSEKEQALVGRIMYREFFGRGEYRFAIYPDSGWKASWGKPPLLGIVNADDEFLAEKLAYDRGVANPNNCSFGLKIKKIGPNSK